GAYLPPACRPGTIAASAFDPEFRADIQRLLEEGGLETSVYVLGQPDWTYRVEAAAENGG
ncbi:MAG: hypothetical protein AAF408_08740, partial [Pseudomonadota bacterium]